ncbi:MAG: hypothetical protein KBB01_01790 [Candidatus Omnitrophica bacterium]|jgi:FKBP-type peptidyl-prolyl cis-trans isomerase (trigger factor)|nr:hypothetical protein [Candidatus Omnitrophota bacterium]
MKVEIEKIDKLKRKIKIEVSGQEFLNEKTQVYQQKSKELKTPGFRAGTAPLEILEKYHGNILKEELFRKVLPLFYQKALDDNKITAAGLPQIHDVELNNETLTFFVNFEVKPEIEVKEDLYKRIKIKDKKASVEEVEIEKVITNLKEQFKKTVNKDLTDEELAKWASYSDISSFREAIRIQLLVEKLKTRRQEIDKQIREKLLKTFQVDLPQSEVERYHKELLEREIYNLRLRGVSQEDIDKHKSVIEERLKPLASDEMKLFYILEAIAKNESIEIKDNFIDVVLGFILSQAEYS